MFSLLGAGIAGVGVYSFIRRRIAANRNKNYLRITVHFNEANPGGS